MLFRSGRWGGEEFVSIHTILNESEAAVIGEKLHQLIGNTEVVHKGKPLKISISVGATVVREGDTIDSVVERADHLMYKSKQNGKDCVTAG